MQYTYDEYTHDYGVNKYKITPDGTAYHIDTPDDLVAVLQRLRLEGTRIKLDYGDVKTGESWGEVHDVAGRISRSTGKFKVPILLNNSRSSGGGSIITDRILSIRYSNGKNYGMIYKLEVKR